MAPQSTVPIPAGATVGDSNQPTQAPVSQSANTVPIPQGATVGDPVGASTQPKDDQDTDNSVFSGFTDKLGKAAGGLWDIAKAEAGYQVDKYGKSFHDVAAGHYMQGVKDSVKAILTPDYESPVHHVIRGMVADSMGNLKDAGDQELEAIKEGYRGISSTTPEERSSHFTQAKGNLAGTVLSNIKAVSPGLVESGQEMMNPDTAKHGFGGALGEAAMLTGPELMGKAGEAVLPKVGRMVEKFGMQKIGGLLKSTNPKEFWYGSDPRKAIIDERINPSTDLHGVRDQLEAAQDNLESEVQQKLSTSKTKDIDVVPVIQQITQDTLKNLANTRGLTTDLREQLVNAIKDYRDNLLSVSFDPQTGKSLGIVKKTRLDPGDVAELRRDVGKSTAWNRGNTEPAIREMMNNYQKEIYARLNDMIEAAEPGTKSRNMRIKNIIGATRLIDKEIPREEFTDVGLRRLGRKLEVGAGLEAIAGGHPIAGAALLGNRAMRTTPGRITVGRGAVDAGQSLQGPGGAVRRGARAAASVAGGAVAGRAGQQPWVHVQTSDGKEYEVHPEDLDKLKAKDPQLKVLTPNVEDTEDQPQEQPQP